MKSEVAKGCEIEAYNDGPRETKAGSAFDGFKQRTRAHALVFMLYCCCFVACVFWCSGVCGVFVLAAHTRTRKASPERRSGSSGEGGSSFVEITSQAVQSCQAHYGNSSSRPLFSSSRRA